MILPRNSKHQCVLSYEPIKAISYSFESHRRSLRHCLNLILNDSGPSNKEYISLVLLVFLDQEFIESMVAFDHSFVDLLNTFPTIKVEFIHFFLVPVGLGWYSYQDLAKRLAFQLFGHSDDKNEFHVLPSDDDDKDELEENTVESICIVFGFQKNHLPPRLDGDWNVLPSPTL